MSHSRPIGSSRLQLLLGDGRAVPWRVPVRKSLEVPTGTEMENDGGKAGLNSGLKRKIVHT